MSVIVNSARAIMACLAPITGTRATGHLTVSSATGGTSVVVPDGAFAVPVIGGSIRYDRGLKVAQNPTSKAGWTVTAATSIPALSNVGGEPQNLAAGTEVRWFPTVSGVELVSVVAAGGLTGGTNPTEFASIQQIGFFDEIAPNAIGETLVKAVFARFPAVLVAWEGSSEATPLDQKHWTSQETFGLYVVGSRQDSDPARRVEAVSLCDRIRDNLVGRTTVDGKHFSSPHAVHVGPRRVLKNTGAEYVFRIAVTVSIVVDRNDNRTWADWTASRLDCDTADDPALRVVTDNRVSMVDD